MIGAASYFHRMVTCVIFVLTFCDLTAQESILQARQRPAGSVVTVTGIILNSSELGAVRYMQDSTAGIAVYPGGSSPSSFEQVTRAEEVRVTGVLSTYHGLLEINPILSYQTLSTNNSLPEPVDRDPRQLTYDDQGRLIRLRCIRFSNAPGYFESGNYPIYTSKGTKGLIYLEGNSPLINSSLPETTVDLIAIASYYDESRFLIRTEEDIQVSNCFHIVPTPSQSVISENGFHLEWTSNEIAIGFCMIRSATGEKDTIETPFLANLHEVTLTDLQPAEFYDVQVAAVNMTGDTAFYAAIPMSTKSTSSGKVSIFFNQDIDASFSNGSSPDGMSFDEMLASIMDLITHAQNTIDIAMYNSNRPDIITALEQAMQRGVRVRYIGDGGQSNSALDPLPDFPLLFRNGDGIMHDKFIVIDPHDPDLAKVWTGSTNHSTGQLSWDPNNALIIQDQALVKAYLHEFEEMWGGNGNAPNPLTSRTGSAKRDDTPHLFQIGNILMENYFSPSDNTNHEILTELETVEESLEVALLLLTRYDLTDAMSARAQEGVRVRVIIDDEESSYGPIETLQNNGVLVAHHDYNSIFHHKYAIIDEGLPQSRVITGSHNWTTSATVRNDENTLIIHDPDIANIYRQEFEARWAEVFSSANHETSSSSIVKTFPNPAGEMLCLDSEDVILSLHIGTITGMQVFSRELNGSCIDISDVPPGMYCLHVLLAQRGLVNIPFVKY